LAAKAQARLLASNAKPVFFTLSHMPGWYSPPGAGWYSSLATPFTLNREPIAELVQELEQDFSAARFLLLVHRADRQLRPSLARKLRCVCAYRARQAWKLWVEALRKSGWTAYLHPTRLEAAKSFPPVGQNCCRPARRLTRAGGRQIRHHRENPRGLVRRNHLPCGCWTPGNTNGSWAISPGRERISVATLAQYAERRNLKLNEVLPGVIN